MLLFGCCSALKLMALIFQGESKCGLCKKVLSEQEEVIGLPPSSYTHHELHQYFDRGFHRSCYDNWNRKQEIEDLIKREKRDFEFSSSYKDMEEKYGPPSHKLNRTNLSSWILEEYKVGRRRFEDLEIENESFESQELEGIIFERCMLYVDFKNANLKNAQFLNGHVKTCDFRGANLSYARFENQGLEAARFSGCQVEGLIFISNHCYSQSNIDIESFGRYFAST
jgi:hypothetical protein